MCITMNYSKSFKNPEYNCKNQFFCLQNKLCVYIATFLLLHDGSFRLAIVRLVDSPVSSTLFFLICIVFVQVSQVKGKLLNF